MTRQPTVTVLLACALLVASLSPASGEVIPLDMPLVPASPTSNQVDITLTAATAIGTRSDSETCTVTGNLLAEIEAYFDPATHQVAEIRALEFKGGLVHFSDMHFVLNFGLLGRIDAVSSGIAGTPTSPSGPGSVTGNDFSALDHSFLLNQGQFTASGTGVISGLLQPVTIDLSTEPMSASADALGSVTITLDTVIDNQATYAVTLLLPVAFDDTVMSDDTATVTVTGVGVIEAIGAFTRTLCTLRSDLARDDCFVDFADIAEFSRQWLATGDPSNCIYTADLHGDNCTVDFADFTVLLNDWLACPDPANCP